MSNRDYSRLGLPLAVAGWKVRWGFESRLRPYWHLMSGTVARKILAVHNRTAVPDELVLTAADLDTLSDEAWAELQRQLA